MVSKKVNTILSKLVKDLEIQCAKSEQYSRRECLEIVGIPSTIKQSELEGKTLEIFNEIGVEIDPENVEACHRIGPKFAKIAKVSARKSLYVYSMLKNKYNQFSIAYRGPHLWNSLISDTLHNLSYSSFRNTIKRILFDVDENKETSFF